MLECKKMVCECKVCPWEEDRVTVLGISETDSILDRLCGLVVRVPGYRTEMYYASCEVRTEFICVI
jgi:hypothetical protein